MRLPRSPATRRTATTAGFTLIELLVTLALLALLASVVAPFARIEAQREQERQLRQSLVDIRTAIDAYKKAVDDGRIKASVDSTGYPPSLATLTEGVEDAKAAQPRRLFFLRRVPRDPFFPDPATPAAATWGYRSYASEASDPKPGADVYDVYSLAPGTGLNGVPYREW